MRLNAVKVLGISITNASKKEILEEIQKYLTQNARTGKKSLKIFTPNTEQLVLAHKNPAFSEILNQADISLPDTVGVVWASKILTKNSIKNATPGVEFMEDLVQMAATRHVPIGLIGGRDNLAVDTLNCLRQKYNLLQDSFAEDGPEISFHDSSFMIPASPAGRHNSNEKISFERLARKIIREGTRIVFVALGPPKQEYFIERISSHVSRLTSHGVIFMSVGGSFDILSGRLPRAPRLWRGLGLEWLWRLILEPWRLRRQLALAEFVWLVLREKVWYAKHV